MEKIRPAVQPTVGWKERSQRSHQTACNIEVRDYVKGMSYLNYVHTCYHLDFELNVQGLAIPVVMTV